MKIIFRLKINTTDEQTTTDVNVFVLPATPIYQPGTFGAIEPAIIHVDADFTIPISEYKWNQIVELQLPDGKKVFDLREK
jgi:hypothetical protein